MKNPRSGRFVLAQKLLFAGLILCVTALTALPSRAQTFRGTILGTVTDPTGAVVPGAMVTIRNVDTGLVRTTETQADGSYRLPEVPIGTYDVTVEKPDFQTSVTSGVKVDVSAERRVDSALKPGAVKEQITVSGEELPEIETTSDNLGGTLTQDSVKDLPINGRDYTKLIYLNPGVAGSPDQITDSPGSFGEFSMNGARGRSNNYLLDGTDMNDGYRNDPAINQGGVFATPSAILPIDAVSDMAVLSNFQPEYGRNGGAVVNIVTRSGTNQIHGSAFEYFRNDVLDARNFFNLSDQPKSPFHNNQFGGSIGGPIVKDKTFFFLDYEGQQEKVGVVTLACVPEPARIAVDEAANGAPNSVIAALLARNPWPAPDHPISMAQAMDPAYDTGCPNGPNATAITPSSNGLTSMIAKIDQSFGQNNILTGRYFFGDSTQSFPPGAQRHRRPASRIQHRHAHARSTRGHFVRARRRFHKSKRNALWLEPVRGRIFPTGSKFSPQFHRPLHRQQRDRRDGTRRHLLRRRPGRFGTAHYSRLRNTIRRQFVLRSARSELRRSPAPCRHQLPVHRRLLLES